MLQTSDLNFLFACSTLIVLKNCISNLRKILKNITLPVDPLTKVTVLSTAEYRKLGLLGTMSQGQQPVAGSPTASHPFSSRQPLECLLTMNDLEQFLHKERLYRHTNAEK